MPLAVTVAVPVSLSLTASVSVTATTSAPGTVLGLPLQPRLQTKLALLFYLNGPFRVLTRYLCLRHSASAT